MSFVIIYDSIIDEQKWFCNKEVVIYVFRLLLELDLWYNVRKQWAVLEAEET